MLIFYDIWVSFANDFVVCLFVCRIKLEIKIFAFKCYMNTGEQQRWEWRGKFVLLKNLFFTFARLNEKLHLTHSLDLLGSLKFQNFARMQVSPLQTTWTTRDSVWFMENKFYISWMTNKCKCEKKVNAAAASLASFQDFAVWHDSFLSSYLFLDLMVNLLPIATLLLFDERVFSYEIMHSLARDSLTIASRNACLSNVNKKFNY